MRFAGTVLCGRKCGKTSGSPAARRRAVEVERESGLTFSKGAASGMVKRMEAVPGEKSRRHDSAGPHGDAAVVRARSSSSGTTGKCWRRRSTRRFGLRASDAGGDPSGGGRSNGIGRKRRSKSFLNDDGRAAGKWPEWVGESGENRRSRKTRTFGTCWSTPAGSTTGDRVVDCLLESEFLADYEPVDG